MNKLLTTALSAALFGAMLTPLANAQSYDDKAASYKAQKGNRTQDEMVPPKVSENMKKMHDQMAAIRMSKDPKEREMRLQEHMKTMHETIDMMGMMEGHDGKKMAGDTKMGGMHKSACSEKMHTMMNEMMEQMMSHMTEQKRMSSEASDVTPPVGR